MNFVDPVNTRKIHEEIVNQVRNGAIHISNKYTVQTEPLQFQWDMFIPTLEDEYLDISNEMLSRNSQQQPFNSNENRSIPNRNWGTLQ